MSIKSRDHIASGCHGVAGGDLIDQARAMRRKGDRRIAAGESRTLAPKPIPRPLVGKAVPIRFGPRKAK